MEGKPSKYNYHEYGPNIHRRLIDHINRNRNKIICKFFGVEAKELTEDEMADFIIYLLHAGKRIINAFMSNHAGSKYNIGTDVTSVAETAIEERFEEFLNTYITGLLAHDLSHAVERLASGKTTLELKDMPTALRVDLTVDELNQEAIQEELFAAIWQKTASHAVPLSLGLLSEKGRAKIIAELRSDRLFVEVYDEVRKEVTARVKKAGDSFEDYYEAFIQFEIEIRVLAEIHNRFFDTRLLNTDHAKYVSDPNQVEEEYKNIFFPQVVEALNYVQTHPDPRIKVLLKEIYDNRDDPKILVKIFFRYAKPYIDKVHNRYMANSGTPEE